MDVTEKKVFRKSLMGGFSKNDVNKYIEESAERYTAQIAELEEKYLAADRERVEVSSKLRSANEQIEELLQKKAELDSLREEHQKLSAENELTEKNLNECAEQLSQKTNELSELSKKVEALAKVEAEYTSRKAELADIEISARARAAQVLQDAENEISAKRAEFDAAIASEKKAFEEEMFLRRNEFNAELDSQKKAFETEKAAATAATAESFGTIARIVDALKAEVDGMDARITRVVDSARENVSELSSVVTDAQNKISVITSHFSNKE